MTDDAGGWLVGATGPEGLTSILGPDRCRDWGVMDWVRPIMAYTCDRAAAVALVARLNREAPAWKPERRRR